MSHGQGEGISPDSKAKILVVKLSDIGDVLTATPALRSLRRSFPHAHITALIPPHTREVLEGSHLVDEVILFEKAIFDRPLGVFSPCAMAEGVALFQRLRRGRYDIVIIMHHLTTRWGAWKYALLALATGAKIRLGLDNGRGWFLTDRVQDFGFGAKHEVEYWVEVAGRLGAKPDYGSLEFPLRSAIGGSGQALDTPGERLWGVGPMVAIHPGSGEYSRARRWPAQRFAQVARRLSQEDGARIVLVGGPKEVDLAEEVARGLDMNPPPINLAGRTNLKELAAFLRSCSVFLGNDSGVMHLAAAVGTSVVALFGPSNHQAWGPWVGEGREGRAIVIRAELSCSPCFYTGRVLGTPAGCPTRPCLHAIAPEAVIRAVRGFLYKETPAGTLPRL